MKHSINVILDLSCLHILQHLSVNQIQVVVRRCSSPNVTEETTYFIPRNPVVDAGTNTDPPVVCCPLLRRFCPCPPRGLLASLITKGKPWGWGSSVWLSYSLGDMSMCYILNYQRKQYFSINTFKLTKFLEKST